MLLLAHAAEAVVARTTAQLDEAVAEIHQAGGQALTVVSDVTDQRAWYQLEPLCSETTPSS